MDRIAKIVKHAEVSEKALERYLVRRVKEEGGLCLKYSNPGMTGYPDRLCLLPGGKAIWVELKSKGEKPTRLQSLRHRALQDIGQRVYVADSREKVDGILDDDGMDRKYGL